MTNPLETIGITKDVARKLEIDQVIRIVRALGRAQLATFHPDRYGDPQTFCEVSEALEEFERNPRGWIESYKKTENYELVLKKEQGHFQRGLQTLELLCARFASLISFTSRGDSGPEENGTVSVKSEKEQSRVRVANGRLASSPHIPGQTVFASLVLGTITSPPAPPIEEILAKSIQLHLKADGNDVYECSSVLEHLEYGLRCSRPGVETILVTGHIIAGGDPAATPDLVVCFEGEVQGWDGCPICKGSGCSRDPSLRGLELVDQLVESGRFKHIVGRVAKRLYDEHSREDFVHYVYEKGRSAWKKLDPGKEGISTFIQKTAENLFRRYYRDRVQRHRMVSLSEETVADPPSRDAGPDAAALDADESRQLKAAIERLKERRELIVSLFLDDLKFCEIAEKVGLHPDTVSSHFKDACQQLGRWLSADS